MVSKRFPRGGGIASSSLVLLGLVLLYILLIVYFVCDSASELERWALLPFRGFPALTCFLLFCTFYFFRTLLHIFSEVLGLSLGLFLFIFYVPGTTEIRFFALKSKKEGTG